MTGFIPVWRGMVGGVLLAAAGINAVTALFAEDSERVYRILISALFIVVGLLLLRSDDGSSLN